MKISLIVPTLNERGSIERLFRAVEAAVRRLPADAAFEAVLVDDGSTDGTAAFVRSLPLAFPVKIVERNERGLATAVLVGFAAATGDVLGVIDADLSHPPELIPELVAALAEADLAVASRHAPGGVVEKWPWYRLYASRLMTLITRPLQVPVADPLSGYFFLKRTVVEGAPLSPVGYKILLEILVKGKYRKVVEIPYVFRNRDVGRSKMGFREAFRYLRHLARLYRWKFFAAAEIEASRAG